MANTVDKKLYVCVSVNTIQSELIPFVISNQTDD